MVSQIGQKAPPKIWILSLPFFLCGCTVYGWNTAAYRGPHCNCLLHWLSVLLSLLSEKTVKWGEERRSQSLRRKGRQSNRWTSSSTVRFVTTKSLARSPCKCVQLFLSFCGTIFKSCQDFKKKDFDWFWFWSWSPQSAPQRLHLNSVKSRMLGENQTQETLAQMKYFLATFSVQFGIFPASLLMIRVVFAVVQDKAPQSPFPLWAFNAALLFKLINWVTFSSGIGSATQGSSHVVCVLRISRRPSTVSFTQCRINSDRLAGTDPEKRMGWCSGMSRGIHHRPVVFIRAAVSWQSSHVAVILVIVARKRHVPFPRSYILERGTWRGFDVDKHPCLLAGEKEKRMLWHSACLVSTRAQKRGIYTQLNTTILVPFPSIAPCTGRAVHVTLFSLDSCAQICQNQSMCTVIGSTPVRLRTNNIRCTRHSVSHCTYTARRVHSCVNSVKLEIHLDLYLRHIFNLPSYSPRGSGLRPWATSQKRSGLRSHGKEFSEQLNPDTGTDGSFMVKIHKSRVFLGLSEFPVSIIQESRAGPQNWAWSVLSCPGSSSPAMIDLGVGKTYKPSILLERCKAELPATFSLRNHSRDWFYLSIAIREKIVGNNFFRWSCVRVAALRCCQFWVCKKHIPEALKDWTIVCVVFGPVFLLKKRGMFSL